MLEIFSNFLGFIISKIFLVCKNYGWTIILFTLFSKIVLFPINILIQKNSIKMVKMKPKIEELKIKYENDKDAFMEEQINLFEKEKYHPTFGILPLLIQIPIILGLIEVIRNPEMYISNVTDMIFYNIDLAIIPTLNQNLIIPILAAISTILLCWFQDKNNVLQKEESIVSKFFSSGLTIVITIYFVFIVPAGVGLYWTVGNVLAIFQLSILNWLIPPKKYVDYDALDKIKKYKKEKKEKQRLENKKSKYYYKKFFEEENINKMKLVFYSEQSGFYKYYKGMIEYILNNSDIVIHYVTSDINDKVFELNNNQLIPYFINTKQLIPLFMKLECDIVVMTTPDLQNLYLKRSIVKKNIEYIFTNHALGSSNLLYRQNALDHYDTIFAKTYKQEEEVRATEKLRNTKPKRIIQTGYTLLEDLIAEYSKTKKQNEIKTIMIAPSWQEDNLLDSCLDKMLEQMLQSKYKIIIRPHPQYIKLYPQKVKEIIRKYEKYIGENFIIEEDFSSNSTIYNSDLVITDWSGIGYEFSFATTKPCLFINTKMKILNPNYKDIPVVPIDIEIRDKVGKAIDKKDLNNINQIIDELINNQEAYMEKNKILREKYVCNLGKAAEIEGEYIINRLKGENNEKKY